MDASNLKQLKITQMLCAVSSRNRRKATETKTSTKKCDSSTHLENVTKLKKLPKRIGKYNKKPKVADIISNCQSNNSSLENLLNNKSGNCLKKEFNTAEEYEMFISLSEPDMDDSSSNGTVPQQKTTAMAKTLTNEFTRSHSSGKLTVSTPIASSHVEARLSTNPSTSCGLAPEESNFSIALPTKKPTPILIAECDFNTVKTLIEDTIGTSYVMRSTKQGFRVLCEDINAHNKMRSYLDKNQSNIKSHTFQPIYERGFRAVIRHLHRSTPITWIREQLTILGYSIRFLDVIKNQHNGSPLGLFELELGTCDNSTIHSLLQLKKLGNQQIQVEKLKRHRSPQCHRCQKYGHTKNYCLRPYVCVKCAGSHPSSDCTKSKEEDAKCANCSGNHTANYRGCKAFKLFSQAKSKRNDNSQKSHSAQTFSAAEPSLDCKLTTQNPNSSTLTSNWSFHQSTHRASYSDILKNSSSKQPAAISILKGVQDGHNNSTLMSTPISSHKNSSPIIHSQCQKRRTPTDRNFLQERVQPSMSLPYSIKNTSQPSEATKSFGIGNTQPCSNNDATGKHSQYTTEYVSHTEVAIEKFASAMKASQEILAREVQNCSCATTEGLNNLSKMIQSLASMFSAFLNLQVSRSSDTSPKVK